MVKTWIVYKHISPSNKVYVGITSKSNPNDRWNNSINKCCHLVIKSAGGFKWKFKNGTE